MMINKQDVVTYIWNIPDRQEVREIWKILAQRSKQLEQQITSNFAIGDKVKWDSKRGYEVRGIVEKINQQTISVRTEDNSRWKVSPSFLKKGE